jgi:hypothetical protein
MNGVPRGYWLSWSGDNKVTATAKAKALRAKGYKGVKVIAHPTKSLANKAYIDYLVVRKPNQGERP